jgi:hypothetical protein
VAGDAVAEQCTRWWLSVVGLSSGNGAAKLCHQSSSRLTYSSYFCPASSIIGLSSDEAMYRIVARITRRVDGGRPLCVSGFVGNV